MPHDQFAAWESAYWDWTEQVFGRDVAATLRRGYEGNRMLLSMMSAMTWPDGDVSANLAELSDARPTAASGASSSRTGRETEDKERSDVADGSDSARLPSSGRAEDEADADDGDEAEAETVVSKAGSESAVAGSQSNPAKPTIYTFDRLIVPATTREALELGLSKVIHSKTIFEDFNMRSVDPRGQRTVLNFFGPPGTGKTFAARCIAHRLGLPIVEVDYSELEDRWVGGTEKNIVEAFADARSTNSIIFFDEADAILNAAVGVSTAIDQYLNQRRAVMLKQFEEFDGIVVFATNSVSKYDPAFARRIVAHIEFALPDLGNRRQLWEQLLPKEVPRRKNVSAAWLAGQSEGFSGGDILNAAWLMATAVAVKTSGDRSLTIEDAARAITLVRVGLDTVGVRSD